MTQIQKEELYLKLKCGLSTFSEKIELKISTGGCVDDLFRDFRSGMKMLDIVCRYRPSATSTLRFSIDLSKTGPITDNVTTKIEHDGLVIGIFTSVNATINEIASGLVHSINENSVYTGFVATLFGSVITIASLIADGALIPTVTNYSDFGTVVSSTIVGIDNIEMENPDNCIDVDGICRIVEKIINIIKCDC